MFLFKLKVFWAQAIIGTDKKNPVFTRILTGVSRYWGKGKSMFFTAISYRRSSRTGRTQPRTEADAWLACINRTLPLKRWSEALKSGDTQRLVNALSGQGAKELTKEIESFIGHHLNAIYRSIRMQLQYEDVRILIRRCLVWTSARSPYAPY